MEKEGFPDMGLKLQHDQNTLGEDPAKLLEAGGAERLGGVGVVAGPERSAGAPLPGKAQPLPHRP